MDQAVWLGGALKIPVEDVLHHRLIMCDKDLLPAVRITKSIVQRKVMTPPVLSRLATFN